MDCFNVMSLWTNHHWEALGSSDRKVPVSPSPSKEVIFWNIDFHKKSRSIKYFLDVKNFDHDFRKFSSKISTSKIWNFWNLRPENFEIWNLKILKSEIWKFRSNFFWRRIFPIGQKINVWLATEIGSCLESFPVRATEGEVFLKYRIFCQTSHILYMKTRFNKGPVLNTCIEIPWQNSGIRWWHRFLCRTAISCGCFGHRKKTENKKLNCHDKRCFNVQSKLHQFKLLCNLRYKIRDMGGNVNYIWIFIT